MAKAAVKESVEKSIEVPMSQPITELAKKIDSLSGKQKQEFCKTLSMSEKKAYINYLKDRDMEMVECVFRCHEPNGGSVTLTARPYEGCEYSNTFVDGHTYTIPLYLAKRMNNEYQGIGTWYPTHNFVMDAQGKPIIGVGKRNHRFNFTSSVFS